jgi:hypothetical protein
MYHIRPDLYPHQKAAISKMHDGCILWGGVGSGKTRAALYYYALTDAHEDIYVITTAKKRDSLDWEEEAIKFGIGRERNATLYGVLHVDSWNNIHKYVDVKNAFFIFDEQRLVGKGKWSKSFLKIARNNRWIMLSATPGDTWLDYIPCSSPTDSTEIVRSSSGSMSSTPRTGKVPQGGSVCERPALVKLRSQILVRMPYIKETVRHPLTIWVDHNETDMAEVSNSRWNIFENRPIQDVSELFHVMRKVVNSDPSRLVALWELMEQASSLDRLLQLRLRIGDPPDPEETDGEFEFAEWNGHKHEPIPSGPKWVYAVQYIAGAEGWNCHETDSMVFWSLTYSYKLWEQAHGRIDRLDSPFKDLYYYTLRSKAAIDWAIWRSLKSKKSFQAEHFNMTNAEFADFSVKSVIKTQVIKSF